MPQAVLAFTPDDPLLNKQGYLSQINAYSAWDIIQGSPEVVVAVLDSGLDLDHPDLAGNLWTNPGEVPGDGIDNDGNGYIDDDHGWDFVNDDSQPIPDVAEAYNDDAVSHGTAIAGVIGAIGNNGQGIAGLNWRVKIMPLRILDNYGGGKSNHARDAVRYALNNGAAVINLSFTGFDVDPSFRSAIQEAYQEGVVVVAAVGNQNGGGVNMNEKPVYPACFQGDDGADWVLGVAALKADDTKADFSNYGSNCVDLSAPGYDIYSTFYQDAGQPDLQAFYRGGWNGTSIASPMVAGAAALLRAQEPGLSPAQIEIILKLSVDPVLERNTPAAGQLGAGRLNLGRALAIASQFVPEMSSRQTPTPSTPSDIFVLAAAAGSPPLVQVYDAQGNLLHEFNAYHPNFKGGVRVALGDVDGDGSPEIITGAGPGGGPHVRIFEPDGALLSQFFAFSESTRFGVFVSAGDVDADGRADISVSADAGGSGQVKVFNLAGENLISLQPYGDVNFGIRTSLADLDGNHQAEIIAATGAGPAPQVKIIQVDLQELGQFLAYDQNFTNGIFVSAADLTGNGLAEIVTGTEAGGGAHVRMFDSAGAQQAAFFAYDPSWRRGVKVAAGRLGGQKVILTAVGGSAPVRLFNLSGSLIKEFNPTQLTGPNLALWSP
ncbi:S8 family serine peptidase [Patescibacteria group bacterium]|nr:S8 family serine peptidase [Patescibacteria group bacterium]